MNKIIHFAASILVCSQAVLFPVPIWAADEELIESVYLDYDPVTGTFTQKMVDPQADPALAQPSAHLPGSQAEETLAVDQPSRVDGQTQTTNSMGQQVEPAVGGPNSFIVWAGIGIVLVLIFGFITRKYQQKPGS